MLQPRPLLWKDADAQGIMVKMQKRDLQHDSKEDMLAEHEDAARRHFQEQMHDAGWGMQPEDDDDVDSDAVSWLLGHQGYVI